MTGFLWLTRDFRFTDNSALLAAIGDGPLLVVFFIDRALCKQGAASRWRLERALRCYDSALRHRSGRGVLILEGEPDRLLPDIVQQTGARRVHQGDFPTAATRATQDRLRAALPPQVELVLHPGHLLAQPAAIRTAGGGSYRVFTPFARALCRFGPDVPQPEAPQRFGAADPPVRGIDIARLDLAPDLHRGRAVLDRFALPAGEDRARERLDGFLDRLSGYAEGRDRPDRAATSELSEHLALGEISPRTVWAAAELRAESNPAISGEVEKFLTEVIWRDFAWHLLIAFPDMAQIPWRPEWRGFPWQGEGPELRRWERAETGIALVDAGLREMRVTGRMHNRVRMVVASWLTKHMLTDWRLGLRHFEESLTDWDPASNAMNWQWVAGCGPDASPFFRIFNPETQAERFDPKGAYRARWLPGPRQPTAEAEAYYDTLPPGWTVPPLWRPREDDAVSEGRKHALESYQAFRRLS
ncbi:MULTISPECIES: cryptochrome/photolyase family protein [unclassified Haematobacter]|uniref:cryptochrome/photolyase family protein n=1 Tax=unclassified Haematobacter TaxID=2640585 RepID=UPI0025C44358|nr:MULTISPECIES: deoxyribodipyrimidine photo-lyase [unclassified Haematobacter]